MNLTAVQKNCDKISLYSYTILSISIVEALMRKNLIEAFRAFYRFAFWSLLIGTVGGAIAGIRLVALETISIKDFIWGFAGAALYGAFFGIQALGFVGLPTAVILALLKLTPLTKYRYLPYVSSIAALVMFYPWWFSQSDGSLNDYIDEQYVFSAVAIVVGIALIGAAYRMVSVDSRQKSKVKRSE
jgi:hypothetical protein